MFKRCLIWLMVASPCAWAGEPYWGSFTELIDLLKAHDARPKEFKIDPEYSRSTDLWVRDLRQDKLRDEMKRLSSEADRYFAQHPNERETLETRSRTTLRSLMFEAATKNNDLKFVTDLLIDGPIGFMKPLIQPEFFLVESCGPSALSCYFDAYTRCSDLMNRADIAQTIRRSFGLLQGEVWNQKDEEAIAVAKIQKWFNPRIPRLRCVDVYIPVSSRKWYFEQGIKENEKLIGLFFLRE